MGAGKSSLGKKIARRMNLPFVDVDIEIENRIGLSITDIFTNYGEDHFRALEKRFIQNLDSDSRSVIAVGGGLPCHKNNMAILLKLGAVFYLKRSAKELLNRLSQSKEKRPLIAELSESELVEFITQKLDEREVFYNKANYILDRTQQTHDWIISRIKEEEHQS